MRTPLRQWVLRITAYADALLEDLDSLDWPDSTKEMQRNWIGRSEGAEVDFAARRPRGHRSCACSRRGPTRCSARPTWCSRPSIRSSTSSRRRAQRDAVDAYRDAAPRKSDLERTELQKDKTGVFTGAYAINPVNGEQIPIWIADYVLVGYGTGAIMAVPAHDERDFEFATKFGLPIDPHGAAAGTTVDGESAVARRRHRRSTAAS